MSDETKNGVDVKNIVRTLATLVAGVVVDIAFKKLKK